MKIHQKRFGEIFRFRVLSLSLSFACLLGLPSLSLAQGTLPSLDHNPAPTQPALTPVQDFSQTPTGTKPDENFYPVSYASPGGLVGPKAAGKRLVSGMNNLIHKGSGMQPIGYSPLPGIVVLPVVKHGYEKAFGDLPLMFAREYAQRLELQVPETRVYHPIYTVDELRMQGLGHVYDQIMSYYLKAGRPEPMAMDYLLKQLSDNSKPISRVIFVEADLDMTHPEQSTSAGEWLKQLLTDGTPKQMRYFVRSRLQVFDAETPEFQMVWGGSWSRSIKANNFLNVTPSVFGDSDSQQAFAGVSRQMSREILFVTPKAAYMHPHYDTAVAGQLAPSKNWRKTTNFSELQTETGLLNVENQEAIQRILRRQNQGSP